MLDDDLLSEIALSPVSFRENLIVRGPNGPDLFCNIQQPFQVDVLRSIDLAFEAIIEDVMPPVTRIWFEGTKGTGKDTLASIALLRLLAFCDRQLTIQVGAADKSQADELRRAAVGILRENEWLSGFVEVQNWRLINRETGSFCEIVPAEEAGTHGSRPDVVVINELTHHASNGFADTMMDNALKVPTNVTLILTNHGHEKTWQHKWRELSRTSARWRFHSYTRPAPWVNQAELAEQRQRISDARYRRLWLGEWVGEEQSALTEEAINAAVSERLAPRDGRRFPDEVIFGGLDIGIKRDRTGFAVISRRPDERAKLVRTKTWKPRKAEGTVDLIDVEAQVLKAHQEFGFFVIYYDPSQCESIAQRLREKGVPMVEIPFTATSLQEMASALLEIFNSGTIEIYRDVDLIADLRSLKFIERGNAFRLDAAKTADGHADLATAFVLAILANKRNPLPWFNPMLQRDLVLLTEHELNQKARQNGLDEAAGAGKMAALVSDEERAREWMRRVAAECGISLEDEERETEFSLAM